jgi:hypothetical protein
VDLNSVICLVYFVFIYNSPGVISVTCSGSGSPSLLCYSRLPLSSFEPFLSPFRPNALTLLIPSATPSLHSLLPLLSPHLHLFPFSLSLPPSLSLVRYVKSLVETIQYYSGHFQQQEEQLARHVQSWATLCDEKLKLSLQKLHTIKKAVATRNEPSYSAVKAGDAGGGMSHEMLEEKLFFAQVITVF